MNQKDRDRLYISIVLSIALFALLSVFLGFIDWGPSSFESFHEPMRVEIGDTPVVSQAEKQEEEQEKQPPEPKEQEETVEPQAAQTEKPAEEEEKTVQEQPESETASEVVTPSKPQPQPQPEPEPEPEPEIKPEIKDQPGRRQPTPPPETEPEEAAPERDTEKPQKPSEGEAPSVTEEPAEEKAGTNTETEGQIKSPENEMSETRESPPVSFGEEDKAITGGEASAQIDLSELDKQLAKTSNNGTQSNTAQETSTKDEATGQNAGEARQKRDSSEESEANIKWENEAEGRQLVKKVTPDLSGIQIQSTVKITFAFEVTEAGLVENLKTVQSSSYTELDARIRTALLKWKFQRKQGAPNVRGRITFEIRAR